MLTLPSFMQGSVLCFPFSLFKRLSWWTLTQGVPRVHTSSSRILSTLWWQWNLFFTIFMSINTCAPQKRRETNAFIKVALKLFQVLLPISVNDLYVKSWLFPSLGLCPGFMMIAYILHAEITGGPLSGQHLHLLTQLAWPTTGTKQTRKQDRKTTHRLSYH